MKTILALSTLLLATATAACTDQPEREAIPQPVAEAGTETTAGMGTETGMMGATQDDPSNPYMSAEMDMHDKMMAAKGSDNAEMWTRKMIEHHKGALTMSEVALTEADDPQVRSMAQKTIDMQTKDIAELQKWLTDNGKSAQ